MCRTSNMTIDNSEILKYEKMIQKLAHGLYKSTQLYSFEDLCQLGFMSGIKALSKFDPSKNYQLSTFLTVCIRRDMIKFIKRHDFTVTKLPIEKPVAETESIYDYMPDLSPQEREIIELKIEGYSIKHIAKKLNISQRKCQSIFQKIAKCVKKESYS